MSQGNGSDGRLHIIASKVDTTVFPQVYAGLFARYSDDDGLTWSTETSITGLSYTDILNSNGTIVESTDGNLYCAYYEGTDGGSIRVKTARSTDNGVSWASYTTIEASTFATGGSNRPINETCIRLIAPNTLYCTTRVNGRHYYDLNISTDNGATWTFITGTRLADWWKDDNNTGTSSRPGAFS